MEYIFSEKISQKNGKSDKVKIYEEIFNDIIKILGKIRRV